ncbi:MAG: hypothetical protein ACI395_02360, partial [Candidatus Cryptobacteroides sp.]
MRYKAYMLAFASSLLALSCSKAPEKDTVEEGFTPMGDLPQVSISTENIDVQEYEGKVYVDVTYSGITSSMKKVELGVMSSTDFDFYQSSAVTVSGSNGTYRTAVPVTPGKTNWIMGMASTQGGASYSRKIAVEVPDVPWYYKIPDAYVGDFLSEASSYPNHQIYMTFSTDFRNAVIYNFDPYVASVTEGYSAESKTSNYIVGSLDLERRVITFTSSGGQFFPMNDSVYMYAPIASYVNGVIRLADS